MALALGRKNIMYRDKPMPEWLRLAKVFPESQPREVPIGLSPRWTWARFEPNMNWSESCFWGMIPDFWGGNQATRGRILERCAAEPWNTLGIWNTGSILSEPQCGQVEGRPDFVVKVGVAWSVFLRFSAACFRFPLARNPQCLIRTNWWGRTWRRKRLRNSCVARVEYFCWWSSE